MKVQAFTRNLHSRIKWLQDVFAGSDVSKSSCYSKSISYYLKYGKPNQKFALLSSLTSGEPTHMVVVSPDGKTIVFDSNIKNRLSGSDVRKAVYSFDTQPVANKLVYLGNFKDLK